MKESMMQRRARPASRFGSHYEHVRVQVKRARRAHTRSLSFALCLLLSFSFYLLPLFFPARAQQQTVVDKMVAVINGTELITYSDLLWQLALQPGTPLENPRAEDLQQALERVVDQQLIAQEAGKLPSIAPTDQEINDEITSLINQFPSRSEFYERLARVGLSAERLREIARQRVEIEKYVNFRFRSFTIITEEEVTGYYNDAFVPRLRRQSPGRIVPTLEESRAEIRLILTESKIESDIDAFLEDARARADIVILNPV